MPWILKIIQGPNDGAEVELPDGQVTRLGRGDACDVMLQDSMMAEDALELDCKGAQVTLTPLADGAYLGERALRTGHAEALPPFTVVTCGDTRLAIGPAGQPWPELTWPDLQALRLAALPPLSEQELLDIAERARASQTQATADGDADPSAAPAEPAPAAPREGLVRRLRRLLRGLLSWLLRLALVALVALAIWCSYRYVFRLTAPPLDSTAEVQAIRERELAKLVDSLGLSLERESPSAPPRRLTGNLPTRQEREQVEKAATTAFPDLKVELCDDETLTEGVQAVLDALAAGALAIDTARDGAVRIIGMVAQADDWRRVADTLRSDVPMLRELTSQVVVSQELLERLNARLAPLLGGRLRIRGGRGQLQFVGEPLEGERGLVEQVMAETVRQVPRNVAVVSALRWRPDPRKPPAAKASGPAEAVPVKAAAPAPPRREAAPALVSPRRAPTQAELDAAALSRLPVSGIMMMPYQCLVLADGTRCSEGGLVEGFTVVKITSTQVIFKKGDHTYTWQP